MSGITLLPNTLFDFFFLLCGEAEAEDWCGNSCGWIRIRKVTVPSTHPFLVNAVQIAGGSCGSTEEYTVHLSLSNNEMHHMLVFYSH